MIKNGQQYVITTNAWFVAPDGMQYKAVWGTCHLSKIEDVFGFTPARPSTNWYLTVGDEGREIIVAGCQIHYAVRCETLPPDVYRDKFYPNKDNELPVNASSIYMANNLS